jgi:RNA polymerase sigma factor (sigma-70 family)
MAVTESGHLASREIDDLYRAHVAEVYRYAFAVLGNHADAEDITQTTFLNAYRALEQGVRPRKPSSWLLTIASNAIKQRFRQEQSRPRHVELDDRIADGGADDEEGPTVGELLTALSKIPPQQRQALVLREFEGRSYSEIAEILDVTTSALETLLFRARRSLADELQHQLTCTDAQQAISRSVDDRLGRKERRRLRDHLVECPDCAGFARLQQRHRSALRGLALVPIPLSLSLFKGVEGASAAVVPIGAGTAVAGGAVATGAGVGAGASAAGSAGGILAGSIGMKAAAVLAAASVAGGVGIAGSTERETKPAKTPKPASQENGLRAGQVMPRGTLVPGNGVALGKATAPGQTKAASGSAARSKQRLGQPAQGASTKASNAQTAKANAPGQSVSAAKRATHATKKPGASANGKANATSATTKPKQNTNATTKPAPAASGEKPAAAKGKDKQQAAASTTPTGPPADSGPPGQNGNGNANGRGPTG